MLRAALSRYNAILADECRDRSKTRRPLTSTQFAVLSVAATSKMVTQRFIRECANVDRSTLSEMLIRLRMAGLVLEMPPADGDKRVKLVKVTPEGRSRLAGTENKIVSANARLVQPLSSKDQWKLLGLLLKIVESSD